MPHATNGDTVMEDPEDLARKEAEDDAQIAKLLQGHEGIDFLNEVNQGEGGGGEKAADAQDYEDIDLTDSEFGNDDAEDLPESNNTMIDADGDADGEGDLDDLFGEKGEGVMQEGDDNIDDLFGGSSPNAYTQDVGALTSSAETAGGQPNVASAVVAQKTTTTSQAAPEPRKLTEAEEEEERLARQQAALFKKAADKEHDPTDVEIDMEQFEIAWPRYNADEAPRFSSLIPQKRAYYIPKTPLKPPKPVQPTKVNLEIEVDQERLFRLPATATASKADRQMEADERGIIHIADSVDEEGANDDEMDFDEQEADYEGEMYGNISWNDLKLACQSWDIDSDGSSPVDAEIATPEDAFTSTDWDLGRDVSSNKKRKLGDTHNPTAFLIHDHMALTSWPDWDDPELATAKIAAKGVTLDMNDPYLLLDVQQPNAEQNKPRVTGLPFKRENRGSMNPLLKRYNISNDEAYEALRENSQHKVRSTLGQMTIEHSLPAIKLQYPFYKVQLSDRELRSFHRPTINFKPGERVLVKPLKHVKKKLMKGKKPQDAFARAEDLSIGDNSDLLLAEYSEEYPITLSNFGMGNKLVNYYRRRDNEDTSRPKAELGETVVLLPQDKSPFSLFGAVDPGDTVPALTNAMYKAPVFRHDPKPTDFLVSRSQTGVDGARYTVRNMQNLYAVGQEFPSVEVPGTHARKVTEASKKRLKMLSFRLWRKGQEGKTRGPWVSNEMIKNHLPGTEIAQNRSRMREIMQYDKDKGTWNPKDGEIVPEEALLRTWIKPEDVCLIDSMHAGDKHLKDAGFDTSQINDDDDAGDGERTELKLAPWHTTKNFLNACQGKAMLEIHGEGDPTGVGEAFSFIKVSMKGGFRDVGESAAAQMDARSIKANGGHSYNVAAQQHKYEKAIARVWDAQKASLSSTVERSEQDADAESAEIIKQTRNERARSEVGTPGGLFRGGDDDTLSQFSHNSNADTSGKVLRIKRTIRNKYDEPEEKIVTITDPEVIRLYTKKKRTEKLVKMSVEDIKPTGNAEFDAQQQAKLKAELARLQRNVERREGREKAKAAQTGAPGTPAGGAAGKNSGATARKCANCGEIGHIKTNKKLCPLLNGQRKQSDTFRDAPSASSPVTVAATPTAATPQLAMSPG